MTTGKLFRDPLTADQLREIGERNKGNQDIITLLWEVKRLRTYALKLDQVLRCKSEGMVPIMLRQSLEDRLREEPVLLEGREKPEPEDD